MRPAPLWTALTAAAAAALVAPSATLHGQDGFKFKSGVELVNVNVTVTDRSGRFVDRLTQNDFVVYDDNAEQEITHFSAERVPVSLGITLDTSGSMVGEKIESARAAIDRFLLELLSPEDEVFLMRFGASPARSWLPKTTKRPASTGVSSARTCATQSRSSTRATAKSGAPCSRASSASPARSGRASNSPSTSHRPDPSSWS